MEGGELLSVLFFPEIYEHPWRTSALRGRAVLSLLGMKQGVLKTLLLLRCHTRLRCQYEDNFLKSWALQMYAAVPCSDWILNLQMLLKFIVFSGVYQTTETEYNTTYIAAQKALLTEGSFFVVTMVVSFIYAVPKNWISCSYMQEKT